jgi:hypothetical protein
MFHLGSSEAHIEAAVLHAIARNELEASAQSSTTEHLRTCRHCQSKLDWIASGLTLVEADSVPDLDALAWHRLETRLRRGIQDAQRVDEPSRAWSWPWPVDGRQLWAQHSPAVVFGLLLLVALGFGLQRRFVSGAGFSRPAVVGQRTLAQVNSGSSQSLLAQTDPSEPTKNWVSRSGRQFQLEGSGLESLRDEAGHFPVFQLQVGHLVVRERLKPTAFPQPLDLRAPGFRATARSSDFAVRYWADTIELEVRQGELAVLSPKILSGPIKKGERKRVRLKPPAPIDPESEGNRIRSARPSVSAVAAPVIQKFDEVKFEQSVDVIPPKIDEISRLWQIAQRQYYAESAIPLAKATAQKLLDLAASDRPERGPALRLLCEAAIAMADHGEAVQRALARFDAACTVVWGVCMKVKAETASVRSSIIVRH